MRTHTTSDRKLNFYRFLGKFLDWGSLAYRISTQGLYDSYRKFGEIGQVSNLGLPKKLRSNIKFHQELEVVNFSRVPYRARKEIPWSPCLSPYFPIFQELFKLCATFKMKTHTTSDRKLSVSRFLGKCLDWGSLAYRISTQGLCDSYRKFGKIGQVSNLGFARVCRSILTLNLKSRVAQKAS